MAEITIKELAVIEDEIREILEDLEEGNYPSAIYGYGKLRLFIQENPDIEALFPNSGRYVFQKMVEELDDMYVTVIQNMQKLVETLIKDK